MKTPEIWLDSVTGRARYRRLAFCESLWTCPICAERITGRRAEEVQRVVAAWRRTGGEVVLVTYTARHRRGDNLRETWKQFRVALRRLKGRRDYVDFRAAAGYSGSIRALEVTYSDAHGWHPHVHEIWLIKPGLILDVDGLARRGYALWARAAADAGLETDRRAYNFRVGGRVVGDYITKGAVWGLGSELARGSRKRGHVDADGYVGATPMQILARAVAGDARAVALWIEYALAMHGQRQLWWSAGLRARFAPQDRLLDPPPTRTEVFILELDGPSWRNVIYHRKEAVLLEVVEVGGEEAAWRLLDRLEPRPVAPGPAPPGARI